MKPTIAFLILLVVACKPDYAKRADKLHAKIVTIDSHTDTPLNLMDSTLDLRVWNDPDKTYTKYDYPRMKAGGLDAAFFAVFLGQRERSAEGNKKAIDKAHRIFKVLQRTIQNDSDYTELALTADDALKIKKTVKRAIYKVIEIC